MHHFEDPEPLHRELQEQVKHIPDEKLAEHLTQNYKYNILLYLLIESNRRKDIAIQDLNRRITLLEEKALAKPGRKRQTFLFEGQELTDEKLVDLIDSEAFGSICELEKAVGAKKNVLRNRYAKAKNKL